MRVASFAKASAKMLGKYQNFVLDCDGVLWHSTHAIEGSIAAVESLKSRGGKVVFVTNNAAKSRAAYVDKFKKLGFNGVAIEHINTSGSAAAEYCKRENLTKVFVIGESGAISECQEAGIDVVTDQSGDHVGDEEFTSMEIDPEVKAVLVGWDRTFNYRKLCMASLYLQAGAKLVACNLDSADKVGGRFMPGNGCAVAAIQASIEDPFGKKTYVAGKPNGALMKSLLEKYDMDPSETLMVGDRLDTDCAFGKNGGVDTLLVLSGCTSQEQVDALDRSSLGYPTFVAADLATALSTDI